MKNGVNFFNKMLEGIGNDVNTLMFGEIKSYDENKNVAEVIPLHVEPSTAQEYAPLVYVPIGYYSIGGYSIKVKPKIGDKLLIFFFDYDVDNLLIDGATKTAKTNRTHSLQDAIVIPFTANFLNNEFKITEDLTIEKEGTETKIIIKNSGDIVLSTDKKIYIGSEKDTHPVALADQIKTIFDNHTHNAPIGGGTTSGPSSAFPNGSSSVFAK